MDLIQLSCWLLAIACAAPAAQAMARLLALRPEGLRLGGGSAQAKACFLAAVAALCLASAARAATPPRTAIVNAATATFTVSGVPVTVGGTATIVTSAGTPATVEFLSYVPSTTGMPPGTTQRENVPVSQCRSGGSFKPLPSPVQPGAGPLTVPGQQPLADTALYASGDIAFVRVTDYDQNRDASVAEVVTVTITTGRGDREVLRLTETGPSTGVFLGYIPTATGAAQPGNCMLDVGGNQRLTATYVDESESQVDVTAGALIDPIGIVFDSSSGQPVNGASVTVIDVATNLPAAVLGNDGVSRYPSTVVTGSAVRDAGGARYVFEPGRYQFPRLAPGKYRLQIDPPPGLKFPSVAGDTALKALPGGPYVITGASRGEAFTLVPGPAIEIDVPVDPGPLGDVNVIKSAGKAQAAVGEFVPYTVTVTNRGPDAIPAVVVADHVPVGFRYQKGSARLNDTVLADPQIGADGRSLQFAVGNLAGNASVTLRYVLLVGPGAPLGPAENSAQAIGRITSNVAKASVLVRDDMMRTRSILAGRVFMTDSCASPEHLASATRGLAGVRVLLEDGTFIATDAEGNWHADNIRPGTHVVQLDTMTLPQGVELQNCDPSSRTGGRDFSQFVNLRGGTLWRADFRFVAKASCLDQQLQRQGQRYELVLGARVSNDSVTATLMLPNGAKVVAGSVQLDGAAFPAAQVGDGFVTLRLPRQPAHWRHVVSLELEGGEAGDVKASVRVQPPGQPAVTLPVLLLKARDADVRQCAALPVPSIAATAAATAAAVPTAGGPGVADAAPLELVEQLPYDDKWLAAAAPGNEWLHPRNGFVPALPIVKVALKHARGTQPTLKVNGQLVNPLRFEGTVMSPTGEWLLSNWRSVDLRDGANALELTLRDGQGNVVLQETRTIHYSSAPSKALLDAERSRLVADGRTPPVIAVRMLDATGKPVRRGLSGEFEVGAPYLSQQQADAIQRDPLAGNPGGKPKFEVGEDGIAAVVLQPTTQSGEVVLRFRFGETRTEEVRAWLNAELREWVLVGFGEGTFGHKKLSGNMEALRDAGADDQLFDDNRLAFYAKGRIRGDFLLTVAYDSAKERGAPASQQNVLMQAIDPTRYYTLYGDATQAGFDAASRSKLYLKIEKKQFYALFGDFDTGLSVTELGRYSRTLTGLRSEYKGERFSYNAFAARTSQAYMKDELQGDGTSGLYRLRGRNILLNSEKVRIEVRDRFHPEVVLSTRSLTGYLDYQLDAVAGTLFFREPVPSRDSGLNPVMIVVEYETDNQGAAAWTYGGRVAMKTGEKSEVGVTRIHEGTPGREGNLTAADATVQLTESTKVHAEIATSDRNAPEGATSGRALLAEVTHDDGTTAVHAYVRRQDPGFGLGQQAAAAVGQRSAGVEARVKLSEQTQLQGQVSHQEDLTTPGRRDVAEARVDWTDRDGLTLNGGVRTARETDTMGLQTQANQVLAGVGYEVLDRKLNLRASTEIGIGSSGTTSYPNRVVLGADYRITPQVTVLVEQEFARGPTLKADTTRVGLRSQLWTGAEAQVGAGNQGTLNATRLYASMGLVQKIKIDDHWAADFAIDRVQTLRSTANPLGPAQPLPSGTPTPGTAAYGIITGDYTAVSTGIAYLDPVWSGSARAEWRVSDTDTKVNFVLGAQRKLAQGRVVAAGLSYLNQTGTMAARNIDARVSYAFRPNDSDWMWLEKLEYVEQASQDLATRLFTRKLISNFNANWKADPRTQVALQYSAKYVRDMVLGDAYSGFTDLMGLEARHDLNERWDIGVSASVLHSWTMHTRSYQMGVSLGYRLTDNTWIAVGYNALGFTDADFTGAEYRGKGLYVAMRVKFDQDTFDLNDRARSQLSLKP